MALIDQVKENIERLPHDDFVRLRNWIADKDWQGWDEQIDKDSLSGKLDFLREEAISAKRKNQLKEL